MFGDIFDDGEIDQQGQMYDFDKIHNKGQNCADFVTIPQKERNETGFVGLLNQGATCYLNSLVQTLFMTPQFQKLILELDISQSDNIDIKNNYLDNLNKWEILIEMQKLFAEMKYVDKQAASTEKMTRSFGWENNESVEQQDIQEAMRVLIDVVQRALAGKKEYQQINQMYGIQVNNYIECQSCKYLSNRPELLYDIMLQVKGVDNIHDSVKQYLMYELLDGDNKYHCGGCKTKQDAKKGLKIVSLPQILTISLTRFDFDFQKFERVKINNEFRFENEINGSMFMEESDEIYELYSVIIHSGSAHGGHYHCYIKDLLGSNEWYDFNDQNVSVIGVDKIQTQFGGKSENAYILVYTLKQKSIQQLEQQQYVKQYVQEQQHQLELERLKYQDLFNSVEMELLIDNYFLDFDELVLNKFGELVTNKIQINLVKDKKMILSYFGVDQYLLEIQVSKVTDLVQFVQIVENNENKLDQVELSHQSWFVIVDKKMADQLKSRDCIGRDKIPVKVNLFVGEDNYKQLLYADQSIADIYDNVQQKYGQQVILKYENKVLESNDLKIKDLIYENDASIQILFTNQPNQHQDQKQEQQDDKVQMVQKYKDDTGMQEYGNMVAVIVRTQDEEQYRYLVNLEWNLHQLLQYLQSKLGLEDKQMRLRKGNINRNNIYVEKDYCFSLQQLNYEGGMLLYIEEGRIPEDQIVCVKVRKQMIVDKEEVNEDVDLEIECKAKLECLMKQACTKLGLKMQDWRIYQTDWTETAVKKYQKMAKTVQENQISYGNILILRNVDSPIRNEFLFLPIYDCPFMNHTKLIFKQTLQVNEDYTLGQLKQTICQEILQSGQHELRIREVRNNGMLGKILKNDQVELVKMNVNSQTQLCYSVLERAESMRDNSLGLFLCDYKTLTNKNVEYEQSFIDFMFGSGIKLTYKSLDEEIRGHMSIDEDLVYFKFDRQSYQYELLVDDGTNLRKKPTNLRDGDIIGLVTKKDMDQGLVDKFIDKQLSDDMKKQYTVYKNVQKQSKSKEQAFKINTNF